VLHGIGGKTIEEAQRRLSYQEFCSWAAYRRMRGSLHVGMRVEHAAALLAKILSDRYRKEGAEPFKIYDFMPHMEEPEVTIDEMKTWG